jgi:hypothetical protein
MSRLQDLHPDQQAVLQLVLRRRMPYADLAGALGLTPEGVRERALDAVDGLAPEDVDGLAMEDRDRIADHLLGQDDGAGRDATATLLRDHEPARTWASRVAAELGPLGGPASPVPGVASTPAADAPAPGATAAGGGTPGTAATAPDPAPGEPAPAPAAQGDDVGAAFAALPRRPKRTTTRKGPARRLSPAVLGGAAASLVVVVLLVLWIAGAFSGDDDSGSESASAPPATTTTAGSTAEDRAAAAQFVAALPQTIRFRAPATAPGGFSAVTGTAKPAVSAQDAAIPVLALTIKGMPALTSKRRYFAWADKNGADPVFLGQLTEPTGAELPFQGLDLKSRQPTVIDPTVYSRVRITLEGTQAPTKPGPTIIVGTITPRS